jgi:Ca2+-binding EF-hand superfamily protein
LHEYRRREGLSNDDIELIEKSFSRFLSKYGSDQGELSISHVGKLLRGLGFSLSYEDQQVVRMQVDVDGSGSLSLDEVYKMVRICCEQEMQAAVLAFKDNCNSQTLMLVSDADRVLKSIGCLGSHEKPPKITSSDVGKSCLTIDLASFVGLACRHHDANRKLFRDNGGFSEAELGRMKATFGMFDEDGSGDISKNELAQLVQAFFPSMSQDPNLRPKMLAIMQEVDVDGSGALDFQDFLLFMQVCRDMNDQEQLAKEQATTVKTDFGATEVAEFRDVFMSCAGFSHGLVPAANLVELIGRIVPLGERRYMDLSDEMDKLSLRANSSSFPGAASSEGESDAVDFPDFLWLMHWILDTNFGNVKVETAGAAVKYRSQLAAAKTAVDLEQRRGAQAIHDNSDLVSMLEKYSKELLGRRSTERDCPSNPLMEERVCSKESERSISSANSLAGEPHTFLDRLRRHVPDGRAEARMTACLD